MIKEKQLEWRNDMNILVIDVGGTFIKYAWMNENAQILDKGKFQPHWIVWILFWM